MKVTNLNGSDEYCWRHRADTILCPQTDRRTDGQTDKVKPVYPPFNFVEAGGIIIPHEKRAVLSKVVNIIAAYVLAIHGATGLKLDILKMESWMHIGYTVNIITKDIIHIFATISKNMHNLLMGCYCERWAMVLKTMALSYPDSKVHGANMGPTWVLSSPDGPHVGPMNLAIRVVFLQYSNLSTRRATLTSWQNTELILGLCPANERHRYFVKTSLIGWPQALRISLKF